MILLSVHYRASNHRSTIQTNDTNFLDQGTTAKLTFLNIGDTYDIYVVATNAGGLSPATPTIQAIPYTPPPTAPTGLSATPGNGQIGLSRAAPASCCPCWDYLHYRDASSASNAWTSYLH